MQVGLTQRVLYHRGRAYDSIEHTWYQFLQGHKPIFIPNTFDQDFEALVNSLDCLIITGGDDSVVRRRTELRVASMMMQRYKPVLGVCHGAMLLTDILGGQVRECQGHRDTEHTVTYESREIAVNSFHDQTIAAPHATAQTLCQDSEGNCEAWIDGLIAGVMWHPERMLEPFLPQQIQQVMKL